MDFLSSTQNQRVKDLVRLQEKASERANSQLFVVEGFREIHRALLSGYQADSVFCVESMDPGGDKLQEILKTQQDIPITGITQAVFQKIAYREGSDGMVAVFRMKAHDLDQLNLPENPVIVVLESVEKPGNLGAILRTCDGAGVDAVIVCDAKTDVYNPNCIRASLGCLFSVQVAVTSTEKTIQFFKDRNIMTLAAALTSDKFYYKADLKKAVAFILGTEADGLSEKWLKLADDHIKIPVFNG